MENESRRRDQITTPHVGFGDRDRVQFRSSILCNFRSSMTIMVGACVCRTPATAVVSRSQVTVGQVRVRLASAHPTSRRGPFAGRNGPCLL